MYRITADREASLEAKMRRMVDLGCAYLHLPYGFLTRITGTPAATADSAEGAPHSREASGEESPVQEIVYAAGDHPLLQAGATCPLSEAYCRKTIRQEELLSIQHAPAAGWASDPAYERFDLGSYIGSKIVVEGELYGTFCFASSEVRDRPFSDAEEAFVELLTRWVSYELERRRSRERTEQFAGLVSHDLRNPLTVAQMRLQLVTKLLRRGAPPQEGDRSEVDRSEVERQLAVIGRALERMEAVIEDTLAVARSGRSLRAGDLTSLQLREIAEAAWEQSGTDEATLQVEADLCVQAHEGRLRQLLENLFRNAIDHVGAGVTVTVGAMEDGFFVADDGPGIPPGARAKVSAPSYTSREEGTGFGLSIVQAVAEAHGWTVSATASRAGGARFEVTGVERSE